MLLAPCLLFVLALHACDIVTSQSVVVFHGGMHVPLLWVLKELVVLQHDKSVQHTALLQGPVFVFHCVVWVTDPPRSRLVKGNVARLHGGGWLAHPCRAARCARHQPWQRTWLVSCCVCFHAALLGAVWGAGSVLFVYSNVGRRLLENKRVSCLLTTFQASSCR